VGAVDGDSLPARADGISLVLVLLTGLAAVAGVLFSWNVEMRTNEFFAFYLALIGGVYGVFLSFDLFLLFVFYEIAIVPKYFLIAIWGLDTARVRSDEAGALSRCRFGDGADWIVGGYATSEATQRPGALAHAGRR